jgi:hypothetical protein
LSGGVAVTPGTFAFTTPSTAPNAGTASQGVTFTPTDTVNYSSASGIASVLVNQATPGITTWPTASAITYGQTLATSTLSAGVAVTPGTFAFTTPTTAPGAGTASQGVTFTPTDTANYSSTSGTASVLVDKAAPVIAWTPPAAITYGTALSATQLNATVSVPGTLVYTPTSGVYLNAGVGQTLSVAFTPSDSANYSVQTANVNLTVAALPPDQITTGADGQITVLMTLSPAVGASMTLNPGTFLTDADGNPISGTLTVAASVMSGTAALSGLVPPLAQTPDGKVLSALGNSIDITISAGTSKVKNINPPMIVNLKVAASFALPGATVSYYSFDGTIWHLEGTAVVKPDGSVDMSVSHLSVWAIASFASVVDASAPVVTTFTMPSTSATLAVSGITVTATDDIGVTGYLLTESATPPLATEIAWSAAIPTAYTFKTWGNNTLYAYAKDAVGNVSAAGSTSILIGSKDGIVIPAADGAPAKFEPVIADALKSLNFAMKVETPMPDDLLHGDVAPLVNGVPQPDGVINLGDTIVILRRVVGL